MMRKGIFSGDGLLNLDKPPGPTSHDVVAAVRRMTRVARVGHAGTLDPQASGVLLIGLGKGTRLVQFLHELPKTYRATLQLGIRTDTHDAEGRIVAVRPVESLSPQTVERVLASFHGTIEQIPPMFSALKQQGERLYTLARQGIEVERQPRRVRIFRLVLESLAPESLRLEVECSGGTYIRVLADDIGERLGCGAHLSALVRTAVGSFTAERALSLAALEEAARQGAWQRHLIPLGEAMAMFPAVVVTPSAAQALAHGVPPTAPDVSRMEGSFEAGDTVAIRTADGTLLAVGETLCRSVEVLARPAGAGIIRLRRVLVE
jgi:tRNA pseudouridine55 synthase